MQHCPRVSCTSLSQDLPAHSPSPLQLREWLCLYSPAQGGSKALSVLLKANVKNDDKLNVDLCSNYVGFQTLHL